MASTITKKEKAAYWFNHISQWRESGQTRSEYCQQHDLSFHAFGYWIGRHRAQAKNNGDAMNFVRAKVGDTGVITPSSDLILQCPNGSKLLIPRDTPAAWLGSLLGQLR